MLSTSRTSQLVFLIAIATVVAGCSLFRTTKSTNLFQSDTFDEWAAARYGSLICGVVSSDPDRLALESSPEELSSLLHAGLLENKPEIKLLAAGSLEAMVGADEYQEIMVSLETSGQPTGEQWSLIQEDFTDSVAYAIFGRIEVDSVYTEQSDYKDSVDGKYEKVGTNYETVRITTIRLSVYHLATAELAWQADIRRKGSTCNSYRDDSDDDGIGGIIGAVVDVIGFLDILSGGSGSGVSSKYPDPPGIENQAWYIFGDFAADVLHED